MSGPAQFIIDGMNYWAYIILMMIGLYAMIAKCNLIKKLIGMSIFQTAIILFYVSISAKQDAGIPIFDEHHAPEHEAVVGHAGVADESVTGPAHQRINVADYANPLPHVLMLTAIVVGVATLGVALAITQKIYNQYGTIEEKKILKQIRS